MPIHRFFVASSLKSKKQHFYTMIKRFSSFIICLIGLSSILFGQKTKSTSFNINWITENSQKVTPLNESFFENEEFDDQGVPYIIISKEIKGSPGNVEISLTNVQYEAGNLNNLSLTKISSDFKVESSLRYGANQAYAIAKITPVRRNSNGQLERLLSYELEIATRGNRKTKSRSKSAGNSVLSEGLWYKIKIESDGIYRVDKAFLEENGIDPNTVNPNKVNIYGNTGDQLPIDNSVFRHDDLVVNPTFFNGNTDSDWDNGEYLLFYGDGANSWEFDPSESGMDFNLEKHSYSNVGYYFLRLDDMSQVRISDGVTPGGTADYNSTEFDDFFLYETESVNLVKSGREWLGENFDLNTQLLLNFNFPNIISETNFIEITTAARSIGGESTFSYSLNSGEVFLEPYSAISIGVIQEVAVANTQTIPFTPSNDNIQLSIDFDKFSDESEGWLDNVALQCKRQLSMSGNFMDFRDVQAVGNNVVEYTVSNVFNPNNFSIWNTTDPTSPRNMPFNVGDGSVNFNYSGEELETFIAFNNSSFISPEMIGQVTNQNLHALSNVDYIILSNPNFLGAAEELAEIHRADGLVVEVVTPIQVYNEFSSGNPDVTAIKMFMKMLYDDAAGDLELAPKYLCVFGDGTYQNRSLTSSDPYVISYQSKNSFSPVNSYVSDDYFGLLDDDESESTSDKMDIGIGRIIARTEQEAFQMVDKVRRYKSQNSTLDGGSACAGDGTNSTFGSWRNKIIFISDDQDGNNIDGNIHMRYSEELHDTIKNNHLEFNIDKIYADAYVQTSTPGGERYYDAKESIQRAVQDGALVVNYIGHGGEKGWAHERILDIPTIRNWTNTNKMPVFVTATCELTRFDDPEFLSAGELIYLNPEGGAIAMMTTTRIVFSGSNQALARAYYHAAFGPETTPEQTLGESYRLTKNAVNGINQKNFSLIGDPALALVHPKKEVYTSSINGTDITQFTDTLSALETVTVSGYVGDENGNILSDFNGFVYPTVYDKEQILFSLANDAGDNSIVPYPFDLTKNVLYNGKSTVANGNFEFTFVIPRDINYQVGAGRISYYAVDGNIDGHGHYSDFLIGGSSDDIVLNEEGPTIELYLNNTDFIDGGITDEIPILLSKLQDENGINTVGNGIGHDLKAVIDENTSQAIILNKYYAADEDSYQSGEVRFQLSELSEGSHTLSLKAWDTHNNSSEKILEFTVVTSEELALDHVLNYPNPFTTRTEFMFEHNAACNTLDVQIQVFTVGGNLAKTINTRIESSGYRANGIVWDGKDDFGDELARGVYVYKVKITTPEGLSTEEFQKLVLLK